jgi:hypothetical protein
MWACHCHPSSAEQALILHAVTPLASCYAKLLFRRWGDLVQPPESQRGTGEHVARHGEASRPVHIPHPTSDWKSFRTPPLMLLAVGNIHAMLVGQLGIKLHYQSLSSWLCRKLRSMPYVPDNCFDRLTMDQATSNRFNFPFGPEPRQQHEQEAHVGFIWIFLLQLIGHLTAADPGSVSIDPAPAPPWMLFRDVA